MVTTLPMTRLTFTWRENNVREQRQNTMLQHLQLIKPKNVSQICVVLGPFQTWNFLGVPNTCFS